MLQFFSLLHKFNSAKNTYRERDGRAVQKREDRAVQEEGQRALRTHLERERERERDWCSVVLVYGSFIFIILQAVTKAIGLGKTCVARVIL